ncbi:MAG: class III poly(R)-hydroxyalkanoic acid synthase subunit PhaC, partial [Gammaproteobacteria bacterium]|nr:class III poly(R)-hydroxyalkanoic acid synthase subunit PhaC [Gammaproteobacteria bacterium]
MFPLNVSGIDAVQELLRSTEKLFQGYRNLMRLRDEDVDIATTPKEEVHRIDKTVLYRYLP